MIGEKIQLFIVIKTSMNFSCFTDTYKYVVNLHNFEFMV